MSGSDSSESSDVKPISASEYERWIQPRFAVKALEPYLFEYGARREIFRRLCGGQLLCVARTANWWGKGSLDVREFGKLGAFLWMANGEPQDHELFWASGTHTLHRIIDPYQRDKQYPVECFGIRLDPAGIELILQDLGASASAQATEQKPSTSPLPDAEARRFATAILAGWPEASQDWAHEKALLFFPDKSISRDNFRVIFRAIQGPKKPGKTKKSGN